MARVEGERRTIVRPEIGAVETDGRWGGLE